jgi:hypothetical protein
MKTTLLLFTSFLSLFFVSEIRSNSKNVERLLEIRFIVMELSNGDNTPKTINIKGKEYLLFKTKEEAYNTVLYSFSKSDVTIVYVISKEEKESERFTLPK